MLSHEDNLLLTQVGLGTPMGALLREYWMPVVQSGEVEPGGKVKRVQLLGERLVVYRGKRGRPGLIGEFCPHRLASLYFGRVEDAGMRCVYHGWAFAADGRCLEMPNEPRLSSRVLARAAGRAAPAATAPGAAPCPVVYSALTSW